MSGRAVTKSHKFSAAIFRGGTEVRKPTRKERLVDELAATTLVTAERKAAVTLSSARNWKDWTYADA